MSRVSVQSAVIFSIVLALTHSGIARAADIPRVVDPVTMKHFVDTFNTTEKEPPVVEKQVFIIGANAGPSTFNVR